MDIPGEVLVDSFHPSLDARQLYGAQFLSRRQVLAWGRNRESAVIVRYETFGGRCQLYIRDLCDDAEPELATAAMSSVLRSMAVSEGSNGSGGQIFGRVVNSDSRGPSAVCLNPSGSLICGVSLSRGRGSATDGLGWLLSRQTTVVPFGCGRFSGFPLFPLGSGAVLWDVRASGDAGLIRLGDEVEEGQCRLASALPPSWSDSSELLIATGSALRAGGGRVRVFDLRRPDRPLNSAATNRALCGVDALQNCRVLVSDVFGHVGEFCARDVLEAERLLFSEDVDLRSFSRRGGRDCLPEREWPTMGVMDDDLFPGPAISPDRTRAALIGKFAIRVVDANDGASLGLLHRSTTSDLGPPRVDSAALAPKGHRVCGVWDHLNFSLMQRGVTNRPDVHGSRKVVRGRSFRDRPRVLPAAQIYECPDLSLFPNQGQTEPPTFQDWEEDENEDVDVCSRARGPEACMAYTCLTCLQEAQTAAGPDRGVVPTVVCGACVEHCHAGHIVDNIGVKRGFVCSCGHNNHPCTLAPAPPQPLPYRPDHNAFRRYCFCDDVERRPMIQCMLCSDWYHDDCFARGPPRPEPRGIHPRPPCDVLYASAVQAKPPDWRVTSEASALEAVRDEDMVGFVLCENCCRLDPYRELDLPSSADLQSWRTETQPLPHLSLSSSSASSDPPTLPSKRSIPLQLSAASSTSSKRSTGSRRVPLIQTSNTPISRPAHHLGPPPPCLGARAGGTRLNGGWLLPVEFFENLPGHLRTRIEAIQNNARVSHAWHDVDRISRGERRWEPPEQDPIEPDDENELEDEEDNEEEEDEEEEEKGEN